MYQINREEFGAFLTQLRKEKGMTQKELAEQLFLSDKAISKWERGQSMPDISLLIPLAEILGVTTTELLYGGRVESAALPIDQVEQLVDKAVQISAAETQKQKKLADRQSRGFFLLCAATAGLELLVLHMLGLWPNDCDATLITLELLMLIFGGWFSLFCKNRLPDYYDREQIDYVTDGIFRMHMPGLYFNNSNWPHIVAGARKWTLSLMMLFPLLYFFIVSQAPSFWTAAQVPLTLLAVFSFFIPIYVIEKKYG